MQPEDDAGFASSSRNFASILYNIAMNDRNTTDQVDQAPAGPTLLALIHAARSAEERLESALAVAGLSGAKFAALSALANAGQPLTLSEIAATLTCVRSNVTQLVDRLEADGLVDRISDPKDRRAVMARLTDLGRERQAAGAAQAQSVFADFDAQLGDADRQTLLRLIATAK